VSLAAPELRYFNKQQSAPLTFGPGALSQAGMATIFSSPLVAAEVVWLPIALRTDALISTTPIFGAPGRYVTESTTTTHVK